jgi:hypothetical protein
MGGFSDVQRDTEALSKLAKELKGLEDVGLTSEAAALRSRIRLTMPWKARGASSFLGGARRYGTTFGAGTALGGFVLPSLLAKLINKPSAMKQ